MKKTPKRKKTTHAHSETTPGVLSQLSDERKRLFLALGVVLILAGVPFGLGKWFEFNSPGAFDSGSYVYSAKHILSGARIGYDEKPSAQAGTLLFNILGVKLSGFSETGSKVLQMLLQAAALTFLFVTVRRIYGALAAVISTTVASVYLSAPLIAKYGNVKEQFMIAFMILGVCCFIFSQIKGKWWWFVLAGAMLVWGPMFKQTGLSAIAAVGGFVLAQPLLHHTGWKRAGKEMLLLIAGAAAVLVPIGLWYASMDTPLHYWPYSFITEPMVSAVAGGETPEAKPEPETPAAESDKPERGLILKLLPGYVSDSWAALDAAQRTQAFHRVLRYYRLLILPILLALMAIVGRIVVVLRHGKPKKDGDEDIDPGRFVLLLALWWFFDMAFAWISPRSYEQYYLPLNASAAMLGGYIVFLLARRLVSDRDKTRWIVLGLLGVVLMMGLSWHIFFGIAKSPHSGTVYTNHQTGEPERTKGYAQKWREVANRRANGGQSPWEVIGDQILKRTEPTDRIYVWGWVPGIYVKAQRLSSAPKPFEGTMHTLPPAQLADRVTEILGGFEKFPPKFIVDTRKSHFPWDRPPLELWPHHPSTRRPIDPRQISQYEQQWGQVLGEKIEPAEGERFKAMEPFRRYVMGHYRIVNELGPYVLFQRR